MRSSEKSLLEFPFGDMAPLLVHPWKKRKTNLFLIFVVKPWYFLTMPQALALRYRPQDFEAVVGQEVTVQTLKNALTSRRLHHAYLFTGPRGIGKTSLARIFAKALNCEQGPLPCNQCVSCREITEGRSLPVLEIDGASNTSVDDVRNLRETVNYLPTRGKYKIYIIDEVHMLSTAAFNALLKTLEEPPAHVIFLLATTDPQKIPATVLSRVIRFDLRAIPLQKIADHLKEILIKEGISADEDALFQVAREAGGGLRDALSLLDQLTTFEQKITLSSVEQVLGLSSRRFVQRLVESILDSNAASVLQIAEEAHQSGIDLKRFALDLLEQIRNLMVIQVSQEPLLFDLPASELKELQGLATKVPAHRLDQIFRLLQKGITELLRAPLPKVNFDVLLLRVTHHQELQSIEEILQGLKGTAAPPPTPIAPKTSEPRWPDFMNLLRVKKPQLASLLESGRLVELKANEVILSYPPASIYSDMLKEGERKKQLEELLEGFFGRRLLVTCVEQASKMPIVEEAITIFQPTKTVEGML